MYIYSTHRDHVLKRGTPDLFKCILQVILNKIVLGPYFTAALILSCVPQQ